MKGSPRSSVFDDIYFSAEDGLEETKHVFLQGNSLPGAWKGRERFTIAETGFGTGLNLFALLALLEADTDAPEKIHYVSFEKYPLDFQEIRQSLEPWAGQFKKFLDCMEPVYPPLRDGVHEFSLLPHVRVTLAFGDVNEMIARVNETVDCWFLDGFKPAANPDMWSDIVFTNMARLSGPGTSFATFTAAGAVKRGLEAVGFYVEKRKGFGRKRDMLAGHFTGAPVTGGPG